ncbi:pro-sigmaK processing inhibitor BofA family protein [Candidatus Micrarchaeota archaeon]|nr:pro-sigmaK processing inhibitor BofA family protein [Candidatus Micrarchaeota archaeon]
MAAAAAVQATGWGAVGWGISGIVLIVLAFVVIRFFKKLLINTVLGVLALIIINYFGTPLGVKIGLNFITVIVSALLGLAGVGLLILLSLFGISLA